MIAGILFNKYNDNRLFSCLRKTFVVLFLILTSIQINAWNRRHIIVLQDNSGSFYAGYNGPLIEDIQNQVCNLFQNKEIGSSYSPLNNEIKQGGLFFNPQTDKVSFYWFVSDQLNNVTFFRSGDGTAKEFENFFFTQGKEIREAIDITEFLKDNFSQRPIVGSCPNPFGISTYSFSAYAFPLCMDIIKDDYAEEYIVLIISDFNAGSTFGNRNDEKIFRDAFKAKGKNVIRRVNELNSEFFKIDYFDYYKTNRYQGLIGFIGYKIRPHIGSRIPENVDLRINSNIELSQKRFRGDVYTLKTAEVVFDHNDKAKLDKACAWVKLNDRDQPVVVDVTSNVSYNSSEKKYIYKNVNIRLNSRIDPSQCFDGEFKFIFYVDYKTGSDNSIKYIYEVGRNIDSANIVFKTKLSNAQILAMISLFLLLLAGAIVVFLHFQGRPIGIKLRWNHFNENYETVDFSIDGSGRVHTDYYIWKEEDFDQGVSLKIEGKYKYSHLGRFYNWKEQTGYEVRITPEVLESPQGYSMYLTADDKVTNDSAHPIRTDTFNDGCFSFKVVIQKTDNTPVEDAQRFKFTVKVDGRSNGLFRKFKCSKTESYDFHIGPELGDVWVGVDPGTTGSCIATATDVHDMTIEKTTGKKDKITPSVIVIKTEKLRDDSENSIRSQSMYGIDADRQKESENYRKFVSIKKLLGYNDSFLLKKIDKKEIKVKSTFLSTLLIEGLFAQHKKYIEKNREDYPQFLDGSDSYAPKRAVFAIPNNFTASKIQDLKSCIQASTLTSLKDIRFIYEAEAILVNHIHEKSSELQSTPSGENIFIFDMGGATINATLANVKKEGNEYEINIIAKLGYGIGGDTIDYAFLKWIYSKDKYYPRLKSRNPFSNGGTMSMSERREHKNNILELKKQLIQNYPDKSKNKLLDRSDLKTYFKADLIEDSEGGISEDIFEKEIQKNENCFLYGNDFEKLVWSNIESIVKDVLTVCKYKGVNELNTVIMSGRSSHFPRVKETVEKVVKSEFKNTSIELLGLEESKSAVAKGACYYGIANAKIKLQNRTVNGVFGVIQTLDIHKKSCIFHRLVDDGAIFDDGVVSGSCPIKEEQEFVYDNRNVRFCQVMGVDAERVIANGEKHKYTEIATIKAQPYAIKDVQITVTEKDKVICSVTDVNGDVRRPVEGVVNDADIVACNDEQYTFFVK